MEKSFAEATKTPISVQKFQSGNDVRQMLDIWILTND